MGSDRVPIDFDVNGLYVLVSEIGEVHQFHWGFYLALSKQHGRVYHMVNNVDTNHMWQYKSKISYGVPESLILLLALKIGVMDPGLHAALEARLETVSADPPVTCPIWLLRAFGRSE
ncbi:hypothetical protein BJX62DRAFT_232639 [Aspergillus germanicus]